MSTSRQIENVVLDDEDLEKRNEALIIENEVLSEQVFESQLQMVAMANRVYEMRGVQEIGIVEPGEVRKLYSAIQAAIEAFVRPMDQFIRENKQHQRRIVTALRAKDRFKSFRNALDTDIGIRSAAMNPMTCIIDIWTASIWRCLIDFVFKDLEVFEKFYEGSNQNDDGGKHNVSSYIKNINKMDNLMSLADPPVFGQYARRVWKRQALAAVFRTGKFEWVQNQRAAKIKEVSKKMLLAYEAIFARPMPKDRQLELMQNIVAAAVRLNEHIQIEADDIWTLDLYGATGENPDHFYNNIKEFDLKPVGTTIALRDSAPLDTISDRLDPEVVRDRVKLLCVVSPALRYKHIREDGRGYQDTANLVRPQVLVALQQLPPAEGEREPAAAQPHERIFFTMAKQKGYVQ